MLQRLRGYIGLLTVLIMLVSLVPKGFALTNDTPLSEAQAIQMLTGYNIVRGDPSGNLQLDQRLTRAQAAALFVRTAGAEATAQFLAQTVPFTDARGHWAAGEIATAQQLGLMKGDGDGTFRPDSDINYAEVLTVLLRMVDREPGGAWDRAAIFQASARYGFAPTDVSPVDPAIRRKIFWSLAVAASRVPLVSGQTLLQKNFDNVPPQLTLDETAIATSNPSVTISGVARDAVQVTVAGQPAALNQSSGRFTYLANLQLGRTTLAVEAVDLAGNVATANVVAERNTAIARIQITGSAVVAPGSSVKLNVTAYNAQNQPTTLDGVGVEMTGNVATFDLASATLTAGSRQGRGVLTLKSGTVRSSFTFDVGGLSAKAAKLKILPINEGRAPAIGKATTLQVQIVDDKGVAVTDDYGRTVTVSASGLAGVSLADNTVTTVAGVAAFTITGSTQGTATITASAGSLTSATTPLQFLPNVRINLTATPSTLKPDGTGTATIRASLQDDAGRAITNSTDSNIMVTLTAAGNDGYLNSSNITIPRNSSNSSGYDAVYKVGVRAGTVLITGEVDNRHSYPVQALYLPVTGDLPGTQLQFTYPATRQTPNSSVAQITVRVVDDQNRLVTAGSYAFQFTLATSNNEQRTAGLPEGVSLVFPNTNYRPVDDGRSATDPLRDDNAVVGRTYQGTATLYLRYNKSGVVTLTPKLLDATDYAYHNTPGFGPAAASFGMTVQPFTVTFAGAPSKVMLTADSALGKGQAGGATAAAGTMTVRAQVVDASGTPVPGYNDYVTLTRSAGGDGVTSISGSSRKQAVNGVAEFTVAAVNNAGYDLYTATTGSLTADSIQMAVRKLRPETPNIAAIRGGRDGGLSPIVGYVAPDADFMEIQLYRPEPFDPAEPHHWATAKVYRKGETAPFFTSPVLDLMVDMPTIRIPKSSLRAGKFVYEVALNNGAGDSPKSPDAGLSEAVNAVYNSSYRIVSGLYDAATGKLLLTTNGTANGTVAKEKLSITKGPAVLSLNSDAVTITSVTATAITLNLGTLVPDPDIYNGQVVVKAQDGWLASADGAQIAKASDDAPLRPMATITHASLDTAGKKLYLHGAGFTQGTLNLALVQIGDVTLRPGSTTAQDRLTATTDPLLTIALSDATLNALNALPPGNAYVTAPTGWLRTTVGTGVYQTGAVTGTDHPLYIRAAISRAQYDRTNNTLTLTGTGFSGGTINPAAFNFKTSSTSTQIWRPGTGATAQISSDTTAVITLSAQDATTFESTFGGRNVLLNTDAGWLVDASGRSASAVPPNSVIFTVPAR